MKYLLTIAGFVVLLLSGCTTTPDRNILQENHAGILDNNGYPIIVGQSAGTLLGKGSGYYMNTQETRLREKLKNSGITITRSGNSILISLPSETTFNTNSDKIKSSGIKLLRSISGTINEYDKTAVHVVGHTDARGSAAGNVRLSIQRATNMANTLIQQGVSANRIYIYGRGSANPVASNDTAQGRAKNRRVDITLTPL